MAICCMRVICEVDMHRSTAGVLSCHSADFITLVKAGLVTLSYYIEVFLFVSYRMLDVVAWLLKLASSRVYVR